MVKDLEGVIKKIKVKVREVNNLTRGERIIVDFDELGMEVSPELEIAGATIPLLEPSLRREGARLSERTSLS